MPRCAPRSLVNPSDHVVRRAALQESDAVLAASRQDAVARRLHFQWIRLAWNREVAERKTCTASPFNDAIIGREGHWQSRVLRNDLG